MGSSKGSDGKQPFQELIGTKKFVEIFKNTIRDYYTYGYKSYSQFAAGEKQLRTRWLVLSEALGEKWEFVKRRHGRNRIALRTMQRGDDHTIEELFFLHYMKEWGDYINCLFDLDPASRFRGGIEKLPVCEADLIMIVTEKGKLPLMNVNELEYAIIENWICGLERQSGATGHEHDGQNNPPGDGHTIVPVRVNRQLKIWSPWTRTYREDNPNDLYKNLSNRTSVMEAFGILGNLKNNPDARETWTSLEYKKYCSDSTHLNKLFKNGVPSKINAAALNAAVEESGRDYWYKSVLTMENLIKKAGGSFPDGEIQKELLESLTVMCSFFSEYLPLGEVGVILEKRLLGGQAADPDQSSCFRFKHNYLQKPLYDYHLIDLWLAIENTYLCKMKYAHATTLRQMEDIGIPLEIRISVNNGREYVMYYQPWEQRIKAMRIEFIDEIEMYSREISAIKLYKKTTVKEGRRKVVKTDVLSVFPSLKADEVTRQIIEAKKMLRFLWGTEINGCSVTDDWNSALRSYKISISYKADTEQYIAARLNKECRQLSGIRDSGTREPMPFIEIKCFPTKELRSWIRSYYQRVYIPELWEDSTAGEAFSISEDIEELYGLYNYPEADVKDNKREEPKFDPEAEIYYGYIVEGAKKPRKTAQKIKGIRTSVKAPAHAGHEELFNEFFSKYAIASANALLHCASDRGPYSLEDFKTILREEVRKLAPFYERLEGKECRGKPEQTDELHNIVERLTEYLVDSGLIDEEGKTRFISSRKDYLFDFLPLTRVEVRWLLTVLEDPLAKMFFSEDLLDAGILEDLRKHLRGEMLNPAVGISGQCRNAYGAGTGVSGTPQEKSELAEKASTEALADFFQKTPFEAGPFPMEKINYFDRYNINDLRTGFQSTGYTQTRSEEEIRRLRTIYQAMRSGRKLRIRFKNWKDEERDVTCSPAWIEYSARDNIFRVWYCDSSRRKVMKINVPRILELEPVQNDGFDLRSEQEKAEEVVREKMKTICIEFYRGVRNLPDRILTEFSLWPKECEYDIHSGKFTMTLHYPVFDEKEILVRLMGYGPYIKIIGDDGGFILKELKKRIRIQRDLIRSLEFERS